MVRHCPKGVDQLQAFTLSPTISGGCSYCIYNHLHQTYVSNWYLREQSVSHCHQWTLNPFPWASPGGRQVPSAPSKLVLFQNKRSCPLKFRHIYTSAFICASCCLWTQRSLRAAKPEGSLQRTAVLTLRTANYWSHNPANTWTREFSGISHITCPSFFTTVEISECSRIKIKRLQYFQHQW